MGLRLEAIKDIRGRGAMRVRRSVPLKQVIQGIVRNLNGERRNLGVCLGSNHFANNDVTNDEQTLEGVKEGKVGDGARVVGIDANFA